MIARIGYDFFRASLRLVIALWPLWLFWFAWRGSNIAWRDWLLTFHGARDPGYLLAYRAWPSVALAGPIAIMLAALVAYRMQLAGRVMAYAGGVGVIVATALTVWPEAERLAPYVRQISPRHLATGVTPFAVINAIDPGVVAAFCLGGLALAIGVGLLRGGMPGKPAKGLTRASSDNHGHADWLSMKEAKKLFPGPDPEFGGIVVGEAYRVDQDRVASRPFDPSNERSWGQGGTAPLLIDSCRSGSTHALVIAGSGGFKTTSVGVPTMLTWTGAAVVLDPSREIGPMVHRARERMGHRVVTLDPNDASAGAFNVLDWIDTGSPLAESNVEAVVGWIAGESGQRERAASGAHFFKDSGKALIACVLADILWDEVLSPREKSLKRLRQVLITPEDGLREVLQRINATSASAMARDLAGTLMGLVAETFSGVYANAARDTRWLSTPAYADLVSGETFEAHEITGGKLTVFVQIPLKTLQATPALGRVIIGALLNAAYEADGAVKGRILFLLDEVSRLGYMGVLEQARDAGRKYGITLLLLYQSLGQLVEQWGREGKQAWYDSTSWRLFAAIQDPETARELSNMCGEHGVMATSLGDSVNASGRVGGAYASNSSGRSENRSEIRRALIKPDELLQDARADEAFVVLRGAKPLRCGRAIYFRRPDMRGQVEASRFHKTPVGA